MKMALPIIQGNGGMVNRTMKTLRDEILRLGGQSGYDLSQDLYKLAAMVKDLAKETDSQWRTKA